MKCWIVFAQENPAESKSIAGRRQWRSNTLAEYLSERGHEVTRWRSSFSHKEKTQLSRGSEEHEFDGLKVQYISARSYHRHIGLARIRSHRDLARNFLKLAEQKELPDVIHVGNVPLELCAAAVRFGKMHDITVVVDIRDLWPDLYADLIPAKFEFLKPSLVGALGLFSRHTKFAFRNSTAIIGLTESYLKWGLAKAGRNRRNSDRVFPMCYPAISDKVNPKDEAALRTKIGIASDDVIACYVGNIGYQSDFETIINAARICQHRIPELKFVIAGSGPREDELKALASDTGNVIFPGWLSGSEVQTLIGTSSIGLIAFKNVKNFLLNIPNKFSEYLAGSLAVSCSIGGEMGKIVQEYDCGFKYTQGDATELAVRLEDLLTCREKLKTMGHAARKLHKIKFDGKVIYPLMVSYLEELQVEHKNG